MIIFKHVGQSQYLPPSPCVCMCVCMYVCMYVCNVKLRYVTLLSGES